METKTTHMPDTVTATVYTSPLGDTIRTVNIADTPYFVGKDVATALGYADPVNALKLHCRGVVKYHPIADSLGRPQNVRLITEPDLYRLIMRSRLPEAERFEKWVVEEVLPAIRRTGGYMLTREDDTPEVIMARAVIVANDTITRQKAQISQMEQRIAADRPKVLFADAVADSKSTCLIGELAKILKQNGVAMGAKRLFKWLREHKYIDAHNIPLQWAMERGLFRIIERTIMKPDGCALLTRTPKLTGKGQQHIINIFVGNTLAIS